MTVPTPIPTGRPTRVLVADDHPAVRAGLVALVSAAEDLELVGAAADGAEAVDAARRRRPDVAVLDVRMPVATGIEITPQLVGMGIRVLVVSAFELDDYVLGALAAGADGYLVKSEDPDRILAAIRSVARGDAALSAGITRTVVTALRDRDPRSRVLSDAPSAPYVPFTAREEEVLRLLAAGRSNQEIARALFIEVTTVKSHVTHVLSKLGITSRVQAALWWREHGTDDPRAPGRRVPGTRARPARAPPHPRSPSWPPSSSSTTCRV